MKFSNGYLVSGSDEMPFEPWALMINGVGWDLFVNVKCARRPLQRISYGGDIGDRAGAIVHNDGDAFHYVP